MKAKPGVVIFDLDGTLIDTMGSFADLAGDLISLHYGIPFEESRALYLKTSGIPFSHQLEVLFPGRPNNSVVAAQFESRKIGLFTRETVSESTRSTLQWLKEHNYRTAISSNNFHLLVKEFARREHLPVDVCLGYKEGFAKGRQHFQYLESYFRRPFGEMLFVGDSLKDAEIAHENGVHFIGKVGTFSRADFGKAVNSHPLATIDEIHEIIPYLEEI